jgi:hypothetical protein
MGSKAMGCLKHPLFQHSTIPSFRCHVVPDSTRNSIPVVYPRTPWHTTKWGRPVGRPASFESRFVSKFSLLSIQETTVLG